MHGGKVIRFSGFEIDRQRAELRGADGAPIKVRPKTFEVLSLLVSNTGRVVTKQELMDAVWPNVHVSDDSLFQCIKELRSALGDADRVLIKAVSGRGYLFDAMVSDDIASAPVETPLTGKGPTGTGRARLNLPRRVTLMAVLGFSTVIILLAVAAPMPLPAPRPGTIAVMPIVDASGNPAGMAMSAAVAEDLIDGLAKIDNINVLTPSAGTPSAATVIVSELGRSGGSWTLKARLIDSATGKVHHVATTIVDGSDSDLKLQQTRLVAGIGDQLARSVNVLLEAGAPAERPEVSTAGKVAIEQAAASINQTSRERFAVAETMLKEAFDSEQDNVDLQIALAAMQLRGIQLGWYDPEERAAAENNSRALLQGALKARPRSIAALEAQCRLLSAVTEFAESLVVCGQVLNFDPWNGSALYLIGLGQLYLGRLEDALEAFTLADRYDTPAVSRWTWLLGAGWANLLLDRNTEVLPWLERSIAITPASGRSHMLLAVAYYRLGRLDEARATMAMALQFRLGSTVDNVRPSVQNASPVFLEAVEDTMQIMARLGLAQE